MTNKNAGHCISMCDVGPGMKMLSSLAQSRTPAHTKMNSFPIVSCPYCTFIQSKGKTTTFWDTLFAFSLIIC